MTPTPQQLKIAEISSKIAAISTQLHELSKSESTDEKVLNDIGDALQAIADDVVNIDLDTKLQAIADANAIPSIPLAETPPIETHVLVSK